jgi:dTDP-glucose 4,6-dehydratase
MKNRKVLITGVQGVVGSKLESELISKGYDVFGVDLYHTDKIYGHGLGKVSDNYFRCDIGKYRQIKEVIEYVQPDIIFNCAAEFGRWNGEHFYEQVWQTNVIGLKHIIRLQEKHRFKLVHFSSSEVYGDYEGIMYEDVIDNVAIDQMNDYAMSKRVNEMQIKNSRIMHDTETVFVRLFNTYGDGEWYHPFRSVNCLFCYNLLHGKPITVYRGHTRTSTYIDDTVRTISNIAENFIPGESYNIASNTVHSIEELAELVLKHTGASKDLVTYKDSEILTTKDKFVNVDKSIKDLNHSNSIDLDTGVKRTVEWMKKYYNI